MSLLSIGLTGLRAAQAGLTTTGHNIANANTVGFSRQQVLQSAAPAQFSGGGYVGRGVNVDTVQRVYSDFLTQSVRDSTAASSAATAYASEVSRIDGFLADSSSNLGSAVDTFFASVQAVANDASDSAARQTMLSSGRTLATRFNDLDSRLTAQGADIDRQIGDNVATINTLASQVARLNSRITTDGRDPLNNQPPNDLLDQRDELVKQIAAAVGATSLAQSDGTIALFIGNGQPLVVGMQANQLTMVPDDQDATKQQLALVTGGQVQRVQTEQITQGAIGGLLHVRDDILTPTRNTLGQIATGLGAALNAQNALGQDANGNPGAALFAVAAPAVIGRSTNSAGAALSVTIADAASLSSADYRLDYDGTSYTLTNLADKSTQSFASLPQTVDGVKIAMSGPLAAGDRFTISPTRDGARDFALATVDPSRIAAAAPVSLKVGSANTGAARMDSLSVVAASPLPAALKAPVDVVFHVAGATTTYDLVDAGTGTAIATGQPYSDGTKISQNGWSLSMIGLPADGDRFTVGPNVGGTGDNRNALLLAAVQQGSVTRVGSAQDAYGGLVGMVGDRTNEASAIQTSEDSLLTQAEDNRAGVSGVNLDEEAVNLQKYQQAYQAAAKSIASAQAMFQAILDILN